MKKLSAAFFLFLLLQAAFLAGYYYHFRANTTAAVSAPIPAPVVGDAVRSVNFYGQKGIPLERNNEMVRAVGAAAKSVVFIGVTQIQIYTNPFFDDPFFRQFFPPSVREFRSMGSGVIISEKGHIVTNYHVIENASKIEVHLPDRRKFTAKLLGADPYTDLAILKIEGDNFASIPMINNDSLYIGEWAIAIGNPFGALIDGSEPTVTQGVISAIHREFTRESGVGARYKDMIQTDASINPGNSGGALVNCLGELIGINTFIFSEGRGGSVGVGFALPAGRVKKTLREILKHGKIRSFYTGISVQDVDALIAQNLKLKNPHGVIINNLDKNSPGKRAGLKVGDVVVKVDDYEVEDATGITEVFYQFFPGDTVEITLLRGGNEKRLPLVLEAKD